MADNKYDFSDFDESSMDFSDFDDSGKAATAPIDSEKSPSTPMSVNNPVEDISQTESGIRGALSGVSLGFADEIEAAARAPFQPKSSLSDLQSIAEEYRRLRGDIRQEYKAAQEANPLTYTAGELGGSLVMPGGGAKILGKGALALGGQVLGSSEADLTNPETIGGELGQLGKEAGIAGSIGLAAEQAMPMIGKTIKGVNKSLGNPLEDMFKAYQQTSKGRAVFGDEARREAEKQTALVSENIANSLASKGKNLAAKQSKVLEEAKGIKVDIFPEFEKTIEALKTATPMDPRFGRDRKNIEKIMDNAMINNRYLAQAEPTEVNSLVQKLKNLGGIGDDTSILSTDEGDKILQALEKGIREQNYNAVPGLREANTDIHQYSKLLEGLGLDKTRDMSYDAKAQSQIANKIQNVVRGIERESEQGVKARQTFDKLKSVLPESQVAEAQDASNLYDITKKAGGQSLFDKSEIAAGAVVGKVDHILSMPTRALEGVSEAARSRGLNGLADGLQKVATEKNDRARKAIMFSLQQNPAYREFLKELRPDEE